MGKSIICFMDQSPTGKPMDPNDTLAEKLPSGGWIWEIVKLKS
jgi:hypothetical protein